METAAQALRRVNQNLTNSGQSSQQTLSEELSTSTFTPVKRERVTKFFLQMAAIYPWRWLSQFADKAAMAVAQDEWLKALQKFEEKDLERGLDLCRSKGGEFPPSIPEFVKMCTPTREDFGIIDEERAYQAFIREDFSNPVVSLTEQALRPQKFDMAQMWARDHKKTFLIQYRICVEDYLSGECATRYAAISHTASDIKRLGAE